MENRSSTSEPVSNKRQRPSRGVGGGWLKLRSTNDGLTWVRWSRGGGSEIWRWQWALVTGGKRLVVVGDERTRRRSGGEVGC